MGLGGYANIVRFGGEHVREGGSITLVSGSPARKPRPGQVALASVGASVEQFVRTVAVELAPNKVRLNCVSPGIIATPMFGEAGPPAGATASNLIPRPGRPEEVAKAILFVVENDFVTGTTVDGELPSAVCLLCTANLLKQYRSPAAVPAVCALCLAAVDGGWLLS
jgi:NAD(P)-dependent dehydrogenase (short-subunit alcohol dehydrogenase family)